MHSSKLIAADAQAVSQGEFGKGLYASGLKRALDFVLVFATLPFLIPFFLIIGALVALDGHSPFFRQERVGQNGKRFYMWKFRTMVPDAEAYLQEYLAENPQASAEWDEKQKLSHDPRITKIGRILRRTSVDELPQLLNVLTGDMSLVWPRPMMPSQQALYPGHAYYRLRPGLTGSWQVSERHTSSFAERATYDDSYESQLTFATDVSILAKTVGVVFRCTGV
ncbi:MAG: sugar transferase [Pseudomonadota bacterium]